MHKKCLLEVSLLTSAVMCCRIQRYRAQLDRAIEDKALQQTKFMEASQAAKTVHDELLTVQAAISPLELEVDKLVFLSQGLCEMTGTS
jgi:hypothetical protein